jgi:hypothetical protein
MKTILFALAFVVASPAFAADKICFHVKDDSGNSGDKFTAEISETAITVDADDSSSAWGGKFTRKKKDEPVNGRDGKTYLDFTGGTSGNDGCSEVLVDEDLLKPSGEGLIKFRCRGEGFGEEKFFCRKDKKK